MYHSNINWSFLIDICSRVRVEGESISSSSSADYPSLPSGDSFMNKIIPNLWAFLVQLLAFIILLVVVFVFAYKPVKKMLQKRQDHIENEIKEADEKNKTAQENAIEAEQNVLEAKKKANEIVEEARNEALRQKDIVIAQTNDEIVKMKLDAEEDIARSKEEAKEEIRKEIIDVALDASKELLKREVNSDDNKKLIDEFVKDIEDKD